MTQFVRFIDHLNEKVGYFISWLTTVLVLLVCYDVFTRYVLNASSIAIQELEWHLFAIIFLVGSAYTLKHDRHVRVDVIYLRFSDKVQAWINFGGSLLFLIPFSILILYTSKNFVGTAFRIGEISPDPGGLPARFIIKAAVPIGFTLLLLQGLALAVKSLQTALGSQDSPKETA
jgi:TRAP-type mannitol/chloroaromatic compound transport system permease small subunit